MSVRPQLDLGPMTGPPEYVRARATALVRAYAGLLDMKEIELRNSSAGPEGAGPACTDCTSFIQAPLDHKEALLDVEHELSHWLFETDPILAARWIEVVVSNMLNRAGIKPKTDQALPYEKHLRAVIHKLWNVLEDWRCLWLWTQLYQGGGTLCRQLWHDVCVHDIPEEASRSNLVTYLMTYSADAEVTGVPPSFEACKRPMRRARNLVEGVDATAALAITGKLVEEITDALLDANPLPEPKTAAEKKAAQDRQEERRRTGEHMLKLLCSLVPRTGPHQMRNKERELGGESVQLTEGEASKRRQRAATSAMGTLQVLSMADDTDTDQSGTTPFQLILDQGAQAMGLRLEQAKQAMLRRQETPAEARKKEESSWSNECGIPIVHVDPSGPLPPPTAAAGENKRILEQMRMRKRSVRGYDGDLDVGALLSGVGSGELDGKFFTRNDRVAQFELLFLLDLSGSMTIGQAMKLCERALADSAHAVSAIRSKTYLWGFSDQLYMYSIVGSPIHTQGVRHGMTHTVQALDVAHQWAKKAPSKRAVLLVTDGEPTSCRPTKSTGSPITDLHSVLEEIRADNIPLAVLGVRHAANSVKVTREMYDKAFGKGTYGMVGSFDEMARELPKSVRIMAQNHLVKHAPHG